MSSTPTPIMLQYLSLKEQHRDALLLFRLGDFYELFYDDAIVASKALDIVLTSRDKDKENGVPMAGIPHHALDNYLPRLLELGFRVAIADQVEDSRLAKGLVRREVVQVVTPGTVTSPALLDARENCYLVAALPASEKSGPALGLAFADVSTGEFQIAELRGELVWEQTESLLSRLRPRELLLPSGTALEARLEALRAALGMTLTNFEAEGFALPQAKRTLLEHFGVATLAGFGVEDCPLGTRAGGALLAYLRETQKRRLSHISALREFKPGSQLVLDATTQRNLELCRSLGDGGRAGTLLSVLDRTRTPMGARRLRAWLLAPLCEREEIELRLSAVEELRGGALLTSELDQLLRGVGDLERLAGRLGLATIRGRELASLRISLEPLAALKQKLLNLGSMRLQALGAGLDPLEDILELLRRSLADEPPQSPREGGLVRAGWSQELDDLREVARDSHGELLRFEAAERERTGIARLKVGYNKVFGYFIEVRKSQGDRIPDRYIRKQTLLNVERYVTEELLTFADRVASARERALDLEVEIFEALRARLCDATGRILATAAAISELDALLSFAQVAAARGYCRPEVHDGTEIHLIEARHPVVETVPGVDYVPGDLRLDAEREQVVLITGPNMAGKSTAMRAAALITVLAQAGSFVPARSARIGLVDRVFTRVGASDHLARGLSTFMVEMSETANILHNCTDQSLILLDEIGRGTSTFDGLAIAWAVVEHLHGSGPRGPRTLFATHYHELTALAAELPRLRNCHIAVESWRDQLLFLRKISPGPASQSYGIQVARLAGLPSAVIQRARQVLSRLEQGQRERSLLQPRLAGEGGQQLDLFVDPRLELVRDLTAHEVERLTPIEAINVLSSLVDRARALDQIP
jgi:DNA mismatch repair protein MutS